MPKKTTIRIFRCHPKKYAANTFSAGQIILIGEILDAPVR